MIRWFYRLFGRCGALSPERSVLIELGMDKLRWRDRCVLSKAHVATAARGSFTAWHKNWASGPAPAYGHIWRP